MPGFIRRYGFFPGTDVVTLIEGVVIVDLPPPGSVQGVGTGTVGIVGEFADVTFGVKVDQNGNITTAPNPVEIFSSQDMLNKLGGFDPTIGDFGVSMGNGFIALRNKSYARLIAQPINFSSSRGGRIFRKLPTNTSLTNPTPVVPMQATQVPAGTEFRNGNNRVRSAARTVMTGGQAYATGTDGSITPAGLPAATQTFNSAGANFLGSTSQQAVKPGDALVLGQTPLAPTTLSAPLLIADVTATVVSTAGYPTTGFLKVESEYIQYGGTTPTTFTGLTRGVLGSAAAGHASGLSVALINDADTYRVVSVTDANDIVIERQDGSNFTATNWVTLTAQPWRLHNATDADTGLLPNSQNGAYTVPARPLDASIAASTVLSPTFAPPALTVSSADPQSGLTMLATNNATGIVYTAAVQGVNAAASASFDALYSTAIDGFLSPSEPAADVNILDVARTSLNIRAKQRSHVDQNSQNGLGRVTVVWPEMNVVDPTVVNADPDPGVGANRDERVIYSWPGALTFVPEAVGTNVKGADGQTHNDGNIDTPGAGWLVAVLSNLPPENNPGQSAAPVPTVLAGITALQRGLTTTLSMNNYITFKQRGICALNIDRNTGPGFMSGVTTSLVSGQTHINRRRIADFIEDSLAGRLVQFAKLPLTQQLKDGAEGEVVAFMEELLSRNNPAAQRIADYSVDVKNGNTKDLTAKGIFVIIVNVQTLATADFIVLQANIGENVQITTA